MKLILGSSAFSRRDVLQTTGLPFECISPSIDEKAIRHENPRELVLLIGSAKCDRVLEILEPRIRAGEHFVVISSDQVLLCNGELREKPISQEECRRFLLSYSEFPAMTVTSIIVHNTKTGVRLRDVDYAVQYFHPITEAAIEELSAHPIVNQCTGGFMYEHPILERFRARLEGDCSSLLGLPKEPTLALLREIVPSSDDLGAPLPPAPRAAPFAPNQGDGQGQGEGATPESAFSPPPTPQIAAKQAKRAKPLAVNYYITRYCNMRCRYCFAQFKDLPRTQLSKEHMLELVRILCAAFGRGCKLTFVGGEPTLCPHLHDLIFAAKAAGATTMLITNGGGVTPEYIRRLRGALDWVGMSIDSANPETRRQLGRAVQGDPLSNEHYLALGQAIRHANIHLKINTVVTRLNKDESVLEIMQALAPERWKVFKVIHVPGQNDAHFDDLDVTMADFDAFVDRHRAIGESPAISGAPIRLVKEGGNAMRGSYVMIDPLGRFFDNVSGHHTYSQPILEAGVEGTFHQIRFLQQRYEERGGDYNWES